LIKLYPTTEMCGILLLSNSRTCLGQLNRTPPAQSACRCYDEPMARCLLFVLLPALLAQTSQPTFEVADIKPSEPTSTTLRAGKGRVLPGGRIELAGITLKELIIFAYGVQENMISGGPGWARPL